MSDLLQVVTTVCLKDIFVEKSTIHLDALLNSKDIFEEFGKEKMQGKYILW